MKKMRHIRVFIVISILGAAAFFLSFLAEEQSKIKNDPTRNFSSFSLNIWKSEFLTKISADKVPAWILSQIATDLLPFSSSGITLEMLDRMMYQANGQYQLVRFRIANNTISIIDKGNVIAERFELMHQALCQLSELVSLPNVEFIISLDDAIDAVHLSAPVFAFAKHMDSDRVVMIPNLEALSNESAQLLQQVDQGIKKYPWQKKMSKAFWRGATTGAELSIENFLHIPRSRAVTLSLEFPYLIDARFTQLVQCKDPSLVKKQFSSYFSKSMSIKEHLKYKYQMLIDGNTCAYSRAYWQLFSNCAILKQASPNIQWYHSLLKPYIHYIPVQNDLSDLPEKIQWAQDHDKEVKKIIDNTQVLARENLKKADVYYYLYLLFLEYAKLQKI